MYPSEFETVREDTSTGATTPLHRNSVHFLGPLESQLNNLSWTSASSPQVWGFNHEFQHTLPPTQLGVWSTEMFSAAAEAIGGVPRSAALGFEVPYTASLLANPAGSGAVCGSPSTTLDVNYSGRRLFAAYLAYNFRGPDTTAARPLNPADTIGFGDDLLWRWARTSSRSLTDLMALLRVNPSYFGRIDPAGGPTTTLTPLDLMNLLHHNWRVANYLNAAFVGDGRYGYPPQFGFSPALDVGTWQTMGSCTPNRLVAIPPKVTLGHEPGRRSITSVDERRSDDGLYTHPLVLQPYGAEYWVARSGSMSGVYGRQLVVTVGAENSDPGCEGTTRLMASVASYRDQADSLWRHPEWVADVQVPQWVNADSLSAELQFVVPDFGNPAAVPPRVAAVTTITAGDAAGGYTGTALDLLQKLRYRIQHELASAPYPQPFGAPLPSQMNIVANAGNDDHTPAWAPRADELVYSSTLGGSGSQIRRRAFSVGNLNGTQSLVHAVAGRNQYRPDWSPRGDWVAFDQDSVAGTSDVFLKNVVTSELRQMTAGVDSESNPVFQPNGQGLAYVKRIGTNPATRRFELRWMNLAGTADQVVVGPGSGFAISAPRWKTEGDLIYFTRADSQYSVTFPGGLVTNLSALPGGRKAGSLDPPRGAGSFIVEQRGTVGDTCFAGAIVHVEDYRRIALQDEASAGRAWSRFMRRGRQFYAPRMSLDGTRVAFAVTEVPHGVRDIALGVVTYDHPPAMNPLVTDSSLIRGVPFSIDLAAGASDPDGDAVYYKAAYLPPNSSLTGSTFTWSNPQAPPGGADGHYVVFVAYDSAGAQDYRVVRYQIQDTGGGCPFVDVRTAAGWLEGNSISRRSPTLEVETDICRIPRPAEREGRYSVRIRENEREESSIDEISLLVVDREPSIRSFVSGERVLLGRMGFPTRVTDAQGEDRTGLFVGDDAQGLIADPGEALLVEFTGSVRFGSVATMAGSTAPILDDEPGGFSMESGGKEIPPDELRIEPRLELATAGPDERTLSLTGIEVQIPDGEGHWTTLTRHYPRARIDQAAFETVSGDAVKLAFVGRHEVRALGRIVPERNETEPSRIPATVARHTRLGSVVEQVSGGHPGRVELVQGDTLELEFEAPPEAAEKERDFYLVTRGAYRSTLATEAAGSPPRIVGEPLEFALHGAHPNPTRGSTVIPFTLPSATEVRIRILDVTGRLVRTVSSGWRGAGRHEVEWDRSSDRGTRAPAGVYFYQLRTAERETTRKLVLLGP